MGYTYIPLNLNGLDLTKRDQLQQFQFQLCDFLNALWRQTSQAGAGGGPTYTASQSVLLTGTNFTLLNDVATPLNGQFYGYSAGARGWVTVPAGPAGPTGPPGSTGPVGPNGLPAYTTITASVTIPPVGSTVAVTVADASWATVGEMIYLAGAGGTGQTGALQVTGIAGNTLTLLNPAPAPAIPPASSSTAGLLNQLSGNTTDFVDGTNSCQNLVNAIQPTIWSMRLRSFNALNNPTFEIDQRNVGNAVTGNGLVIDRWGVYKAGTMAFSTGQQLTGSGINLPGTNFSISRNFLRVTLTTQEASLAAGDYLVITQSIEGCNWRELQNDVHSFQVLVRSSVANLVIGISLRDATNAHSLTNTLTLGAANTWVLLTLPNLPVWPPGNTCVNVAGQVGCSFNIALASGTTYTSPANSTWQSGYFFAAAGQSNFAASPVNSTFDVAFVQYEPGAVCSTPMDLNFTANLNACQRYYTKSYNYSTLPGTNNSSPGEIIWIQPFVNWSSIWNYTPFPVKMARAPTTVTAYSTISGAINTVRDNNAGVDRTVTSASSIGDSGFTGWAITGQATTGNPYYRYHYTADTGW